MRATFVLPKVKDFEQTLEISKFVMKMVDRISTYKVTPKLHQNLMKLRANYESKREANQEKKKANEERLRREKEEKWANMTPKERKRAQEIEAKRARNRGMRKMKVK